MQHMEIGQSGITASKITFGGFGIGGGTAWSDEQADRKEFLHMIDQALELGLNSLDTAPSYGAGRSEEWIGEAIDGRRERFIVTTKCGLNWRDTDGELQYERDGYRIYRNFSKSSIEKDLENSLKRLKTDYIDIYMPHRQPPLERVPDLMDTLLGLKKQGKIRAIGISNASAAYLSEYLKCGRVDLVQERFSMLEQSAKEAYLPLCEKNRVTFEVFSALERGMLTGNISKEHAIKPGDPRSSMKSFQPQNRPAIDAFLEKIRPLCNTYQCSLAVLVLSWTLSQSGSINLLVGARRTQNLIDSLRAAELVIKPEDLSYLSACADETIHSFA